MALQEATDRTSFGSLALDVGFEFRFRSDSEAVSVPAEQIHEIHPFALMVGILADHPLRDEFLEILGVGIENDAA